MRRGCSLPVKGLREQTSISETPASSCSFLRRSSTFLPENLHEAPGELSPTMPSSSAMAYRMVRPSLLGRKEERREDDDDVCQKTTTMMRSQGVHRRQSQEPVRGPHLRPELRLQDVDVPEDTVAGGNVVGDGAAPRREAAVGPEELAEVGPEPHAGAVPDGLPLQPRGGDMRGGRRLEDLAAAHAEKEGLAGGGEVATEATPEADGAAALGELDGPPGALVGAVACLGDRELVALRHQILAVVAPQPNRLRAFEDLHLR